MKNATKWAVLAAIAVPLSANAALTYTPPQAVVMTCNGQAPTVSQKTSMLATFACANGATPQAVGITSGLGDLLGLASGAAALVGSESVPALSLPGASPAGKGSGTNSGAKGSNGNGSGSNGSGNGSGTNANSGNGTGSNGSGSNGSGASGSSSGSGNGTGSNGSGNGSGTNANSGNGTGSNGSGNGSGTNANSGNGTGSNGSGTNANGGNGTSSNGSGSGNGTGTNANGGNGTGSNAGSTAVSGAPAANSGGGWLGNVLHNLGQAAQQVGGQIVGQLVGVPVSGTVGIGSGAASQAQVQIPANAPTQNVAQASGFSSVDSWLLAQMRANKAAGATSNGMIHIVVTPVSTAPFYTYKSINGNTRHVYWGVFSAMVYYKGAPIVTTGPQPGWVAAPQTMTFSVVPVATANGPVPEYPLEGAPGLGTSGSWPSMLNLYGDSPLNYEPAGQDCRVGPRLPCDHQGVPSSSATVNRALFAESAENEVASALGLQNYSPEIDWEN